MSTKRILKWIEAVYWLSLPFVYTVYSLIRGAITHWYPYPFMNVYRLGYSKVFQNCGFVTLGFLATGLLLVALDRFVRHASQTRAN